MKTQAINDKHANLVAEAVLLKKAWLFAIALSGRGSALSEQTWTIPKYGILENRPLKREIENLKADFEDAAKVLINDWKSSRWRSKAEWCAKKFDEWGKAGFEIFEVGRIQDVEQSMGQLTCRKHMDCPPYGQLLLQGLNVSATRHPEYHLATDLALLFNLLLDSEAILDDALRRRQFHTTEHSQSLARSVILTCFNLLESFVSGIALAYLMENPNAPPPVVNKLKDDKLSLRRRFLAFPDLILNRTGVIDDKSAPFAPLFGECKQRRDSFVHCEPGPNPTKFGYVKEEHFHDADLASARQTVDLTCELIRLVWKLIHGKDGPSWLPKRDDKGRFERVTVQLVPVPTTDRTNPTTMRP